MNHQHFTRLLPSLALVCVSALAGFSLSRIPGGSSESGLGLVFGGALLALLSLFIGSLFFPSARRLEASISKQQLIGQRIGFSGFSVALAGWLVGVLVYAPLGFVLVIIGVVIGFVGMAVHAFRMFKRS